MTKVIKVTLIIMVTYLLVISIPIYSNASFDFSSVITDANGFLDKGAEKIPIGTDKLKPISKSISNILLTIAYGVTIISAIVMAINFTIQSVEDKAKIKEAMIPWVIGIIVSFGAFVIWQVVMGILNASFL